MRHRLVKNYHFYQVLLILIVTVLSGCVKDPPFPPTATNEKADLVYDWYKLIIHNQIGTAPPPVVLQNNRDFSYVGIGLYESVQHGINGGRSLSSILYQMPPMPQPEMNAKYSWEVSANAALASLFHQFMGGITDADQKSMDSLENAWNEKFMSNTKEDVFKRSQEYGRAIAWAIHEWSKSDNFNLSSEGYDIPVFDGSWEKTPPGFVNPVGPFLKNSRPYLESSLTAQTPPMPIPYSEEKNSKFYGEANEVYQIGLKLTDERKAIARYWADFGGPTIGYAGGGHLLYIITDVLQQNKAKLGDAAEVYAKTGIALKETIYHIWKGKYEVSLLRPITYINKHIDPNWQSWLTTPPYPDYPSGLAALYCATFQTIKMKYGDKPITDNAYNWRGDGPKKFSSITKMVAETADSRVYGGIHYRFTQKVTLKMTEELGDKIAQLPLVSKGHD
ncbi:MAG TPA: vanadium-dependent haloperoxidase [Flavitalea sp.]|nr:vanadium-dependent haloperoxidase [Flavitalea sp.]